MLHDPQGSPGECSCDIAQAHGGWCQPHGVGHFAGLRFTSKQLGEVLDYHGHTVSIDKMKCAICRGMVQSGEYCEECHMGFVDGRGYFSRLCYQIAKGKPIDATVTSKPCCENAGAPKGAAGGWCDTCKKGVVGNRLYTSKADYLRTCEAVEIFKAAIAQSVKCETCAVAMVADARCPTCRINYQNGKPIGNEPQDTPKKSAPNRTPSSVSPPEANPPTDP